MEVRSASSRFLARYFRRLGLSQDDDAMLKAPSLRALCQLHEAHLRHIPFDNTVQHGATQNQKYPAQTLDVDVNARKILDDFRGGFCFELNGLFAKLLKEFGFAKVRRVPATVYAPDVGWRGNPTHMFVVVSVEGCDYICDVGFGEPYLHPLRYDTEALQGLPQETPEGMLNRLVKSTDVDDFVILYWYREGQWKPRLRWRHAHTQVEDDTVHEEVFARGLEQVQHSESIFSRKMVVCRIERDRKMTLAGNVWKITGPPRFGESVTVHQETLSSHDDVRRVLLDHFRIPMESSVGLDLDRSNQADTSVWSHM